jgi:NAD(P)-dependent dehydrogenase (short-subunit alcohol dehydrogenase family)
VTVEGAMLRTVAALPRLQAAGHGGVINISRVAAQPRSEA